MTVLTEFRTINSDLAGKMAIASRQQGFDISNVVSMLRSGIQVKAMATSTLLAGFQHAAKLWAGHIILGIGEPPAILTPQPGSDIRSVARAVALEVQSWLDEKRLVNGKEVELIEATSAQREQFIQIIEGLIRLTQ